MQNDNSLYVLSFTVGGEAGLALVSACSVQEAIQQLRSSGRRREVPESYVIQQSKHLGIVSNLKCGLLMEAYVNALAGWDLIEDKFNLICDCDGTGPSPSVDYVTPDQLIDYVTKSELSKILNGIVVTGVGEINILESVKVNGNVLPIRDKAVDVAVPTKVSELTNDLDFATKEYVDSHSGGSSSGSDRKKIVEVTSLRQTMDPGKYYLWISPITELALTLNTEAETSGYINEYSGEFTVGSGFTGITLPAGVTVADLYYYQLPQTEYFHVGAVYQFSIIRNVMTIYSSYIPTV